MIPQRFNLELPALQGAKDEQPRVVMAIATEITNPMDLRQKTYHLACFIRHHDINYRLATTQSDTAVCLAAKEMDDNLQALGIQWDGSFQIASQRQLEDADSIQTRPAPTPRIVQAE